MDRVDECNRDFSPAIRWTPTPVTVRTLQHRDKHILWRKVLVTGRQAAILGGSVGLTVSAVILALVWWGCQEFYLSAASI